MADAYIKPEDVSPSDAQIVLDFLNGALSADELAEAIEIPGETDIGIRVAQHIFDRRQELGAFNNLQQVADVQQIGPERFTELVTALLRIGAPGEPELTDERLRHVAVAASIIEAARIIRQGFRELPSATAGVPILAVPAGAGITIKCDTKTTLYSEQDGEDSAYDWPFGKTAAQVKRIAMRGAEIDARNNVTKDLTRQAQLISCENGCYKRLGPISTSISIRGHIIRAYSYGVADVYYAEATAEGSLTVGCY